MKRRNTTTLAITLPTISLEDFVLPLKNIGTVFSATIDSVKDKLPSRRDLFRAKNGLGSKLPRDFSGFKRKLKIIIPVFSLVFILGIALFWAVKTITSSQTTQTRVTLRGATATTALNEELLLPIKDDKGKQLTKIKYFIKTAELRDEILVQGKRATTIGGRQFLILTVEITNDYEKAIQINARDFIRLSVNGDESKWVAPEIHNDPVDIRPGSTKTTRLGMTLSTSDSNLRLRIGEISGDKKVVEIKF